VLVPMQCEYYALEGLSALMGTIEQIRASVNPDLELEASCAPCSTPRNNLSNEVAAQLIMHFGDKVFRTVIRATCVSRRRQLRQGGDVLRQGFARRTRIPGAGRRVDPREKRPSWRRPGSLHPTRTRLSATA